MKKIFIGMLLLLFLTSCIKTTDSSVDSSSNSSTSDNTDNQPISYKDTYKNFYGYDPTTFNYAASNSAEDAVHFANFVDGLYEGDRFGIKFLPALANGEPVEFQWNEDGQSGIGYKIKIKKNIPWVNSKGEKQSQYGYLKPSDFVTVAKLSLNYRMNNNAYIVAYPYHNFIRGAEAFTTSSISSSNPDFSKVGIKADDQESEYSVSYHLNEYINVEAFKSILSNSCFFPVNADFYAYTSNKGVAFGTPTNLDSILYNGGYTLKSYVSSYIIEYAKNPFYWDAEKIKTPKISLISLPSDAPASLSREFFEAGQIDTFVPNILDIEGYKTYITGNNNQGSIDQPVNNKVQVFNASSPTTWYQSFNLDRDGYDTNAARNADLSFGSALTNNFGYRGTNNGLSTTAEQIVNTRKALRNKNFRLGILHSFPREIDLYASIPHNPKQWMRNTLTMKDFTITSSGTDYTDLIANHYAIAKGGSKEAAINKIKDGNDALYDLNKANDYFTLAKSQLAAENVKFPVAIISPYPYDQKAQTKNYEIEKFYNGGTKVSNYPLPQSDYGRFNSTIRMITVGIATQSFDQVMNDGLFDMLLVGWTPDYADPLSYVSTHCSNGTMSYYLNKLSSDNPITSTIFSSVDDSLYKAKMASTEDKRLEYIAEAEYRLIYEEGLVLPTYADNIGTSIIVSRVKPFQRQANPIGTVIDKYKGLIVRNKPYTNDERIELNQIYQSERAQYISALN